MIMNLLENIFAWLEDKFCFHNNVSWFSQALTCNKSVESKNIVEKNCKLVVQNLGLNICWQLCVCTIQSGIPGVVCRDGEQTWTGLRTSLRAGVSGGAEGPGSSCTDVTVSLATAELCWPPCRKARNWKNILKTGFEQCCAVHIVQCCQQYCSALLHLIAGLIQAQQLVQYCW